MHIGVLKIVIMICYTSPFSVISVLYRKKIIISVNININNFTVNFKSDIVVKLSPWFCGWIESTFYVYLPFIFHRFVTRVVRLSVYFLWTERNSWFHNKCIGFDWWLRKIKKVIFAKCGSTVRIMKLTNMHSITSTSLLLSVIINFSTVA